jgi:hypothetical protein
MAGLIKVLVFQVDSPPEIKMIRSDVSHFQKIVGGYIEGRRLSSRIWLFCNENGYRDDLPPNRNVPGVGWVVGDFFLSAGDVEGESVSMTEHEVVEWLVRSSLWPQSVQLGRGQEN